MKTSYECSPVRTATHTQDVLRPRQEEMRKDLTMDERDHFMLPTALKMIPENAVTLRSNHVCVNVVLLTETGVWAASDRLADVIHGVTEFVKNQFKENV